jgi:hypothetical protein
MTQAENRESGQRRVEDAVAYKLDNVGYKTERAFNKVNAAFAKTNNYFNEALIEVTDTVGEPRLTEHMHEQMEPGVLAHPDLLGILKSIDPELIPQIIPRFEAIAATDMAAERKAVRHPLYTAKNIGKSLLRGFGGGIRF